MKEQRILEKLADILRKNGYSVTKQEYTEVSYPSIQEWIENAELPTRAINAIYDNYVFTFSDIEDKDMLELIADVKCGDICKLRNVGAKTQAEIKYALERTLNINI